MLFVDFGYEYQRILYSFHCYDLVIIVSSLISLIPFKNIPVLPLVRCVVS